ncbi:uncharacterized protein LOC132205577 [Neocloeon triangulifer]|uniref:uncharacterized protein LOC132205577 n=1 Tax=Neocloeon triangulifer TaxID=2078957 RepID=UPI00286EFAA6|nr:uncharacterized protein LOC132205577 [Neocloeon triangulifer]
MLSARVLSFLTAALALRSVESKICDGFYANGIEDDESGVHWLSCPQDDQPFYYTECCASNQTLRCCPHGSFIQYFDEQVVMIVSIVVISICVLLIVLTLVCCFSSNCPMYNLCRVNYTQGGVVAYSKEEEPLTGHPQDEPEQKSYIPSSAIKIKHMDEV